jgi:galactose mutarotase-like enzyme
MENETLRVTVIASKGAEVAEFRYKPLDLDLLWHTPQPMLPAAQYIPTRSSPSGAFRDYYTGGWQEIFPNGGSACDYRAAPLGLHGEVALLPWDVHVVTDTAQCVEVDFLVQTVRTPFRLVRRMIIESGRPNLRLEESVVNQGEVELNYMWGHHPAFGEPFLEQGCRIDLPPCRAEVPDYGSAMRRHFATKQETQDLFLTTELGARESFNLVPARTRKTEDVLLLSNLQAPWAALTNPKLGLTVRLAWDPAMFRYMWLWQHYGGNLDYPHYGRAYVVALEPFTSPVTTLDVCARDGTCPRLAPNESANSSLEIGISTTNLPGGV